VATRKRKRTDDAPAVDGGVIKGAPTVSGMAVLDVGRSDRAVLEGLEPEDVVRAASEWSSLMDGRLELRESGVVWVPGEYARRFGFIEFHLAAEDVVDIRVEARPSLRGVLDIDLTDHRHVAVRVPDPDRWRAELDRAAGQ
jgi:hypothetical protein